MTNDKAESKTKEIMGIGDDGVSEVDEDNIREQAQDDKAESIVKVKAAENKEQTTRRRVRHNRG